MQQHIGFRGLLRVLLVILGTLGIVGGTMGITSLLVGAPTTTAQAQPEQAARKAMDTLPTPNPAGAPKVGELIRHRAIQAFNPSNQPDLNFTLRATDVRPLISQQEAMQVVQDRGVPWALGGEYDGKPVQVEAVYGLGTFGRPGDTSQLRLPDGSQPTGVCAGWLGPCPVEAQTCKAGECRGNGKVIGRIENRPIWIIDYANTVMYSGGCPECPMPPPYNHTVYAVDAIDKFVIMVWGYTAP